MILDSESYRLGGLLGQLLNKLHFSDPQDFVLLSSFGSLSLHGLDSLSLLWHSRFFFFSILAILFRLANLSSTELHIVVAWICLSRLYNSLRSGWPTQCLANLRFLSTRVYAGSVILSTVKGFDIHECCMRLGVPRDNAPMSDFPLHQD